MISWKDVKQLLAYQNGKHRVSTLSLNIDGHRFPKRDEWMVVFKNLLKQTRADLDQTDLAPELRQSVEEDFEKMERYLRDELDRNHHRGLLIYSSSQAGLWLPFAFPIPLRSKLVVLPHPYTLPLTALLDQYPKYAAVIVSQERARIFEVYMGEIVEHSEIYHEVPGKVQDPTSKEYKSMPEYGLAERRIERRGRRSESPVGGGNSESGVYGLAERKIERHVEQHVRHHFKRIAEITFTFFRDHHFDWLILGGQPENVREFESTLHRYLTPRIIGRIKSDPKSTLPELLAETLKTVQQGELAQKEELLRRIKEGGQPNGHGILGLLPTLHALMQGAVQTLVIQEGLTLPGARCPSCGHLVLEEERTCPDCGTATEPVADLIEEAVEEAIMQGAQVVHLPQPALSEYGGMGALLRYQPAKNTEAAKGAA